MKKLIKRDNDNFDVFDDSGNLLGSITRYNGYVEKKIKDRRIVASRRSVKMWSARRVQKEGAPYERTMRRFHNKKAAIEWTRVGL